MEQLRGGSALMHGQPHMQVLCGTSLPALQSWEDDRLFMTVDVMYVPGGSTRSDRTAPVPLDPAGSGSEAHIAKDDDALLLTAQSQMLVYRALVHGVVEDLRIVPLSSSRGTRQRSSTGSLSCIEEDKETQFVRQRLIEDPPATEQQLRGRRGVADFIAGRIPGTGTHVGMSRRLFSACRWLDELQVKVAREEETRRDPQPDRPDVSWEDAALEAETHAARMSYHDRLRYRNLRGTVREGFEQAERLPWGALLGDREPAVNWPREGLLEGATAETYIAVQASDPVLRSIRD
ncbi:hypothetical protein ACFY0A_04985 [Streptomyces sp. NPDC001698]|uniref:hypothetical protein n=1 Tax=Streptomyces sp. NPDC001698 TaxID=3364601 RepID=UPI00367DA8E1